MGGSHGAGPCTHIISSGPQHHQSGSHLQRIPTAATLMLLQWARASPVGPPSPISAPCCCTAFQAIKGRVQLADLPAPVATLLALSSKSSLHGLHSINAKLFFLLEETESQTKLLTEVGSARFPCLPPYSAPFPKPRVTHAPSLQCPCHMLMQCS